MIFLVKAPYFVRKYTPQLAVKWPTGWKFDCMCFDKNCSVPLRTGYCLSLNWILIHCCRNLGVVNKYIIHVTLLGTLAKWGNGEKRDEFQTKAIDDCPSWKPGNFKGCIHSTLQFAYLLWNYCRCPCSFGNSTTLWQVRPKASISYIALFQLNAIHQICYAFICRPLSITHFKLNHDE